MSSLSAKEIKKLAKPEFAANPDRFYPTATLRSLGFHRATCPVDGCGHNYWRCSEKRTTCGDSQCEKRYSFIGLGTGKGRGPQGKKITYAEAWEGFRRSLTSAKVPCTAIPRYPVVARWRADVDYVAAGIFCFQPCQRTNASTDHSLLLLEHSWPFFAALTVICLASFAVCGRVLQTV